MDELRTSVSMHMHSFRFPPFRSQVDHINNFLVKFHHCLELKISHIHHSKTLTRFGWSSHLLYNNNFIFIIYFLNYFKMKKNYYPILRIVILHTIIITSFLHFYFFYCENCNKNLTNIFYFLIEVIEKP